MRSAQKLSEFAFYVADLPDDDARLVRLRLMQAPYGADVFAATDEASRFISRIGFDLDTYEHSPRVLLDLLVDIEAQGTTSEGLATAPGTSGERSLASIATLDAAGIPQSASLVSLKVGLHAGDEDHLHAQADWVMSTEPATRVTKPQTDWGVPQRTSARRNPKAPERVIREASGGSGE